MPTFKVIKNSIAHLEKHFFDKIDSLVLTIYVIIKTTSCCNYLEIKK